jgi:hypothetical protein
VNLKPGARHRYVVDRSGKSVLCSCKAITPGGSKKNKRCRGADSDEQSADSDDSEEIEPDEPVEVKRQDSSRRFTC